MTTRPRVLQVAWRYSRGGGKTQVGRDLIAFHDPAVVELHAFSMRPLLPEDAVGALSPAAHLHSGGVRERRGRTGALAGTRRLLRVAGRVRPDVVHLHAGWDWWILPYLLRRRPRVVVEIHDPPGTGKASDAHGRFLRLLVNRLGAVPLTHSTWNQARTAAWLGRDVTDVRLIPLGIELAGRRPSAEERRAARERLGLPADGAVVAYVARLVPTKRPELFVQVAREVLRSHPTATFVLAGRGPLDDVVAAACRDLGAGFRQLGFVDRLDDVFRASDLFVSTSAYEGFGLAVAEAMAFGVVPVAVRVGGLPDVVGDSGVLVDDPSASVIATVVRDLLDDDRRRAELGLAAERRAHERFDVREFVGATQQLWCEVSAR